MIRSRAAWPLALALLAASAVLAVPAAAVADALPHDGSVVVQINADQTVPADTHRDLVIVVRGDAMIEGEVNAVIVIDGSATVDGGRVESLVVVGGTVDIGPGAVVDDVRTLNAIYNVAPDATVGSYGSIDPGALGVAMAPVAFAAWIGFAVAYLLAGLLVAAIAGSQLRRAGASLTREPLGVAGGAIAALVGLPIVVALLAISVVGIPAALAIAIVGIPAIWFFGSLAVAVRVGDWLMVQVRGRAEASHPVVAAFLGLVVVGVVSVIPLLGFLVGLAGAGAAVLVGWRAAFAGPMPAATPLTQPGPAAA